MPTALAWLDYAAKFLIAAATATVLVVNQTIEDGIFTPDEWFPIVVGIGGAILTFVKANGPRPS